MQCVDLLKQLELSRGFLQLISSSPVLHIEPLFMQKTESVVHICLKHFIWFYNIKLEIACSVILMRFYIKPFILIKTGVFKVILLRANNMKLVSILLEILQVLVPWLSSWLDLYRKTTKMC